MGPFLSGIGAEGRAGSTKKIPQRTTELRQNCHRVGQQEKFLVQPWG